MTQITHMCMDDWNKYGNTSAFKHISAPYSGCTNLVITRIANQGACKTYKLADISLLSCLHDPK